MKLVVVIASRRVLASVSESDDHKVEPSKDMLSKHDTIDGCRSFNRSRASIHSIHRVRQRSFNLCTVEDGCVMLIGS